MFWSECRVRMRSAFSWSFPIDAPSLTQVGDCLHALVRHAGVDVGEHQVARAVVGGDPRDLLQFQPSTCSSSASAYTSALGERSGTTRVPGGGRNRGPCRCTLRAVPGRKHPGTA